mmetsp:Transcript_13833/g.29069  ORF Transcript_13833/g.29069 Transcript_13833/m.29069 type:complete len:703 (+) Transcript_13833:227-2335(+)
MAITGIIRPPPDIRVVADRTAMFVAKNGRAFESRIVGSAKGKTPKFAFLQTTSPFHAYYEDRIRHFESGGGAGASVGDKTKKEEKTSENDKQAAGTDAATADAASKQKAKHNVTKQKASVVDPVAKAIMRQRSVITDHLKKEREKHRIIIAAEAAVAKEKSDGGEAPGGNGYTSTGAADRANNNSNNIGNTNSNSISNRILPLPVPPKPLDTVHVVAPYHLTSTQIETIQLVAQFVAMDGRGGPLLPALVNREWSNPDFAFCQPRNIHFAYFSALVDAYRKTISELTTAADSKAEAQAATMESSKQQQNLEDALNDAAYRTEYERELERRRQKQQENPNTMEDGEIANVIDWHDFVVVETIDFPIEERVDIGVSMLPTKKGSTTAISTTNTVVTAENGDLGASAAGTAAATNSNSNDMDMEESSDDDEDDADSNIRVVPSYTPRVVGTFDPSTARAVDPLTGKSVSVADMPEHMRIQLLDPKWAEERKKFQDKQKDSNLVGGDAVVANIARLAAASTNTNTTAATNNKPGVSQTNVSTVAVNNINNYGNAVGTSVSGAQTAPTGPAIGPATGRLDPRQQQQHQQQQQAGPQHPSNRNGFGAPPMRSAEDGSELPPSKRQRTTVVGQQQHKVTVAPPLVTRFPTVVEHSTTITTATTTNNPTAIPTTTTTKSVWSLSTAPIASLPTTTTTTTAKYPPATTKPI